MEQIILGWPQTPQAPPSQTQQPSSWCPYQTISTKLSGADSSGGVSRTLPFYHSIDNTIGRPQCRGRKLLFQPEGPEIVGEFIFSRHPFFELSRVDGSLFKFAPDLQVLLPTRHLHTLDSNIITINGTGRRHHPHLTVRLGMIQGF